MSDETIGILVVVGIIVLAIFTRGSIFQNPTQTTTKTPVGTEISDTYSVNQPNYDDEAKRIALEEQVAQTQEQIRLLQIEVDKNIANKNASIYKDKVYFTSVSNPADLFGFINISSSYFTGDSINITGWKVRSTITGNEQIIGKAKNLPNYPGSVESNVFLPPSSNVILSEFSSPIGSSFRINKCVGFLAQDANFVPTLVKNCPLAKDNAPALSSEINYACLDYIDTLPRCKTPRDSELPEDTLTLSCKNYLLTQINYNECVSLHKNDSDFYSKEWRLYPETSRVRWLERYDSLQLIDSSGKIVDTYSY